MPLVHAVTAAKVAPRRAAKVQLLLLTSRASIPPGFHLLLLLLFQVFSISTQQRKTFVFASADGHRDREREESSLLRQPSLRFSSCDALVVGVMRSLALPRERARPPPPKVNVTWCRFESARAAAKEAENKSRRIPAPLQPAND